MSHRVAFLCGLLSTAIWSGCVQHRYELDMSFEQGRLQRKFAGSSPDEQPLPDAERDRLSKEYGTAVTVDEQGRSIAEGTFNDVLPQDIGGAGYFHVWTTSMGSLTYCTERFRGNDDLAALLKTRLQAADQLIQLLSEWVRHEATDPAVGERIVNRLQGEIKRDLKNLSLLQWTLAAEGANEPVKSRDQELLARCIQYLLEHDWLTLNQLPQVSRGGQHTIDVAREAFARKFGLEDGDTLVQVLPALRDEQGMEVSLNRHLATSDLYVELAGTLARQEEPHDVPTPSDVVGALIFKVMGVELSGGDELKVRFRLPHSPIATNGMWSEEGELTWSAQLEPTGQSPRNALPALLYAAWSEPNAEFQQQHFGRVFLEDKSLGEYVLWREGLSDAEGTQWDEFLSRLQPESDIELKFDRFEFTASAESSSESRSQLRDKARELIKAGLRRE